MSKRKHPIQIKGTLSLPPREWRVCDNGFCYTQLSLESGEISKKVAIFCEENDALYKTVSDLSQGDFVSIKGFLDPFTYENSQGKTQTLEFLVVSSGNTETGLTILENPDEAA